MTTTTEQSRREAAHLLAGPVVNRIHEIGELKIPADIKHDAIQEIERACRGEDDEDLDPDEPLPIIVGRGDQ